MTQIIGMDAWTIRVPLTRRLRTSNKSVDAVRHLVVRVVSADGVEGWGEAALNPTFTDEQPATAHRAVRSAFERFLRGRRVDDALAAWPEVRRAYDRQVALCSALSISLWDLRARVLELPLHALLGATQRTEVDVAYQIGNLDADLDAEGARHGLDEGFRHFKLKVGRTDVRADVDAVARIRDVLGDAELYVDANQAWSPDAAEHFIRAAAEYAVRFVEQPTDAVDPAALAALARLGDKLGVVVAADEGVYDLDRLLAVSLAGNRPSGVVVKLLKSADVAGARDALRLAPLLGTVCLLAGMPGDTSIVSAALLHLAMTAPVLELGSAITPYLSREHVTAQPLPVREGQLCAADLEGPGLGIRVDPARVAALAER
jgi:L-alanine-DL-glutamate epimerase-like enolase superfamily enzyme